MSFETQLKDQCAGVCSKKGPVGFAGTKCIWDKFPIREDLYSKKSPPISLKA